MLHFMTCGITYFFQFTIYLLGTDNTRIDVREIKHGIWLLFWISDPELSLRQVHRREVRFYRQKKRVKRNRNAGEWV